MNDARMAGLAYQHFKSALDDEKKKILSTIKNLARQSDHDVVQYAGALIAINSLDDIQTKFEKQIHMGEHIEKELVDGHPAN